MAEEIHECPECHEKRPYDEHDWRFDPRFDRAGVRSRIICGKCWSNVKWQVANGQALQAKASRNFRASGTSESAAQAASLRSVDTCLKILRQLNLDPLTPDEIADICGMVLNTVRARITDMKEFGYVKPNGSQRQTHAGGFADVIEITKTGRDFVAGHEQARDAA